MSEQQRQPQKRSRKFTTWLGWLLSIAILCLIFLHVPVTEVYTSLRQASFSWLLVGSLSILLSHVVRGFRWTLMFRPAYHVSLGRAFSVTLIALSVNAVIPGRIGEPVRIFLGARRFKTPLGFTTATLVIERLLDTLSLILFLGGSLLVLYLFKGINIGVASTPGEGTQLITVLKSSVLVVAIFMLLAVILLIPQFRGLILRFLFSLPKAGKLFEKLTVQFSVAIQGLFSIRTIAALLGLSAATWMLVVLSTYFTAIAMDGVELTLLQAFVITAISVTFSAIPSAPGAWGVFESGVLLAVKLLMIPGAQDVVVAYALVLHGCQYIPTVVGGALSLSIGRIKIREVMKVTR